VLQAATKDQLLKARELGGCENQFKSHRFSDFRKVEPKADAEQYPDRELLGKIDKGGGGRSMH